MLANISSKKEKILALRAQLNFRKFVLKQDITINQDGINVISYSNKI